MNAGGFRYVWRIVQNEIIDSDNDTNTIACPHHRWSYSEPPPYCHECMEPGLRRLVEEGARDDEILPAFAEAPIPDRRWMEATLSRLRGEAPREPVGPTPYAQEMIPKIIAAYGALKRNTGRGPSQRLTARRAEVDRDTLADWIRRGWIDWPPE